MSKTKKVLEINEVGHHYICIRNDSDPANAYRVYTVWYDGGHHRKLLMKYNNMASVLFYLYDRMARN